MNDDIAGRYSNCFSQVMLGLQCREHGVYSADLFSRGCVIAFREKDFASYGYPFTQIFEVNVLKELILLSGLGEDEVLSIEHGDGTAMQRLRDLCARGADVSIPALVNTASALISISRFQLASQLLMTLPRRELSQRDEFELGWLEFLISNRIAEGRHSQAAFARMRRAAACNEIPPSRRLDVCAQGVVWYLKRREIDESMFRWCLEQGRQLVRKHPQMDFAAISGWFRGLAMLPAASRNVAMTRECMEQARSNATSSLAQQHSIAAVNALKTFYESSIKEYLYVRPDREAALVAAADLIALDPAWAPSYGECAQVYAHFGQPGVAAQWYETAAERGPPYFCHHLIRAARCWRSAGHVDRAALCYTRVLDLVPLDRALKSEANMCFSGSATHEARAASLTSECVARMSRPGHAL